MMCFPLGVPFDPREACFCHMRLYLPIECKRTKEVTQLSKDSYGSSYNDVLQTGAQSFKKSVHASLKYTKGKIFGNTSASNDGHLYVMIYYKKITCLRNWK